MLEEKIITASKIAEIFKSAFMEVSDVEDNRFSVKGVQFSFMIRVKVNIEQKTISFIDYNPLHRITPEAAATLCNSANNQFRLARFYAFKHDAAVIATCEYEMTYEKGVIPFQIISNFRAFENIAGLAVRDLFKEHLKP